MSAYTFEQPTKSGHYAIRAPGCPDSTMVVEVLVEPADPTELVVDMGDDEEYKLLTDKMFKGLEWAPMPIPK